MGAMLDGMVKRETSWVVFGDDGLFAQYDFECLVFCGIRIVLFIVLLLYWVHWFPRFVLVVLLWPKGLKRFRFWVLLVLWSGISQVVGMVFLGVWRLGIMP